MGRISRRNNVEEEIEINGRMGSYRQKLFLRRDTKRLLSDEMRVHWLQKIMPKHADKGNIRILNPNIWQKQTKKLCSLLVTHIRRIYSHAIRQSSFSFSFHMCCKKVASNSIRVLLWLFNHTWKQKIKWEWLGPSSHLARFCVE